MHEIKTTPNKITKQIEKNGIIIRFAKIDIIESLLNKFAQTGNIKIFVLKLIARALASFSGILIFLNKLVINGASDIIANMQRKDN